MVQVQVQFLRFTWDLHKGLALHKKSPCESQEHDTNLGTHILHCVLKALHCCNMHTILLRGCATTENCRNCRNFMIIIIISLTKTTTGYKHPPNNATASIQWLAVIRIRSLVNRVVSLTMRHSVRDPLYPYLPYVDDIMKGSVLYPLPSVKSSVSSVFSE